MRTLYTLTLLTLACRTTSKAPEDPVEDPDILDTDLTEHTDPPAGGDTDTPTDTDAPVDTDAPGDTDRPADTDDAADTDEQVPNPPVDGDGDSVLDAADLCPGLDDRVDLNADGTPDCAQNLLTNGQMTSALPPWWFRPAATNRATATWDGTGDASGWSGSGSAAVINTTTANVANAAGLVSECVTGAPSTSYGLYFHYRLDSPLAANDTQIIPSFLTYSDDHCQVAAASSTPGPRPTVRGGWQVYQVPAGLQMWPAWRSFEVQLEVFKPGITQPIPFSIDDVLILQE